MKYTAIIFFNLFLLNISKAQLTELDLIKWRQITMTVVGDSLSEHIPKVDSQFFKDSEQKRIWALQEIEKSIKILSDESVPPELIPIANDLTAEQLAELRIKNEEIESLRLEYFTKKSDALYRLGIPEVRKYLYQYSDVILSILKKHYGFDCRQCLLVISELDVTDDLKDSLLSFKSVPIQIRAKIGDIKAENFIIDEFNKYAYDSLGWEWKKIISLSEYLLFIGSEKTLNAFFRALESGNILERFFKGNYEKDKKENLQITTSYALDPIEYDKLLREYSTEYTSLASILLSGYANYDPDALVYFRKWINNSTTNRKLNALTKETITNFFYRSVEIYLGEKFNRSVIFNVYYSKKGFEAGRNGMNLFYD